MNNFIGVDVSEASLDAFSHVEGAHRQFANDARGIAQLVKWAGNTDDPLIVFEATGPHHRLLETKLDARGMPLHGRWIKEAAEWSSLLGRRCARVNGECARAKSFDFPAGAGYHYGWNRGISIPDMVNQAFSSASIAKESVSLIAPAPTRDSELGATRRPTFRHGAPRLAAGIIHPRRPGAAARR